MRTAIFFGSSSGNTREVANIIASEFEGAHLFDVEKATKNDLEAFDFLIFGVSTWGYGDLQHDWQNFLKTLQKSNLTGKTIALFGLGDQKNYPDTFLDGLGQLYETVCEKAHIIGYWPMGSYNFNQSKALVNGHFAGLALDADTQRHYNAERISGWCAQLKAEISCVVHQS